MWDNKLEMVMMAMVVMNKTLNVQQFATMTSIMQMQMTMLMMDKMVMMKTSNHSVHLLTTTFLNVLWSGRVKQSLLSEISSELVSKANLMYGEVEQGPLESGWRSLCSSVQEIPNAVHQLIAIVNLAMMTTLMKSKVQFINLSISYTWTCFAARF